MFLRQWRHLAETFKWVLFGIFSDFSWKDDGTLLFKGEPYQLRGYRDPSVRTQILLLYCMKQKICEGKKHF